MKRCGGLKWHVGVGNMSPVRLV